MREQVILNVKGYPVKVEITYTTRNSRSYRYSFGIINVRMTKRKTLTQLQNDLNKVFSEDIIKHFVKEPLIDGNYAFILGEVTRVYPVKEGINELDNLRLLVNGKKISAKKYLYNIIKARVDYFERQMGLLEHEVSIKRLTAVLGNNCFKKKHLSFNERLIHFSIDLIDQVVIHELCHDFYQNHSPDFYKKLKEYCPDYKERKQKLIYGVRR